MGVAGAPRGVRAVVTRIKGVEIERGDVVRALVIAGLFALALFAVPELIGIYWIKILTAAAIYSVVALGLGLLYGRVGMVSLCQVALLAVGAWVASRLLYVTGLPFPIVLVIAGLVTGVIGTVVGLPALRVSRSPSGPDHAHVRRGDHARAQRHPLPERRRRLLWGSCPSRSCSSSATSGDRESPTSDPAYYRYTSVVVALMFLLALLADLEQAGPGLGGDPRERAGGARGGRQHHALQAVGVRARVVHDGRRRRSARRAVRSALAGGVSDAGLDRARWPWC